MCPYWTPDGGSRCVTLRRRHSRGRGSTLRPIAGSEGDLSPIPRRSPRWWVPTSVCIGRTAPATGHAAPHSAWDTPHIELPPPRGLDLAFALPRELVEVSDARNTMPKVAPASGFEPRAYRAAFAAAGGRPEDATAPFGFHVHCGATTEAARGEGRPFIECYVRTRLYAVQRPFDSLVDADVIAIGDPDEILRVARRYGAAGFTASSRSRTSAGCRTSGC